MKHVLAFLLVLLILMGLVFGLWKNRAFLLEQGIESSLNQELEVFFNQTLEVSNVDLNRQLQLHIHQIQGSWQAPQGAFPLEIRDIRFEDSLFCFVQKRRVKVVFEYLRPQGSQKPGIQGEAIIFNDAAGTVEVTGVVSGLALEDLLALDPEHLKGASGTLVGNFYLKTTTSGHPEFRLELTVAPPGGRLQARFFDLLLPYLPAVQQKVLEAISRVKTVKYQEAKVQIALEGPESVKALLSLEVPDYNLNLNLNLTFRVESQEVFMQLAELFGLIKVSDK